MWDEVVDGRIHSHYELKKFQGIGHSFRQAKYAAAAAALHTVTRTAVPGTY